MNDLPKSAPLTTAAKATEPADEEVHKPATAAEAAQALDLSTFPLLPDALETKAKTVAHLEYTARLKASDVRSEYEFQRRNLLERQWKELGASQISAGYAEGQFTRSGFQLYVVVQLHDERGKVVVKLENKGNVNVSKLPVPSGAKFVELSYNIASFETTAGVAETKEAVRKLLLDQGWQPAGSRGDRMILKQNAVELAAVVQAQSTPPGNTRIAYWTVQLATD